MNVSVALATHNGEAWLREQLDSLAHQTMLPCELVVSDDQSSDRTLEIVEEFAASAPFPVKVIVNRTNLGFADNFLSALRHCKSDATAYCDQDDVWNPSKLERCIEAMGSASDVTLIHHDCEEVDHNLRSLGIILRPAGSPHRTNPAQSSVARISSMGCCMVIRSNVVDALLAYWPEAHLRYVRSSGSRGALGHDLASLHLASILGRVLYLPDVLVLHRRHPRNTWSNNLFPVQQGAEGRFAEKIAAIEESARLRAVTASLYQEMAQRAESRRDAVVACRLRRIASRDCGLAHFSARRAELYRTRSRRERLARFLNMMATGTYGSIARIVDRVRCALKDLAFALMGPRASCFLEAMRARLGQQSNPHEVVK
jgi:glycosyltransferase involved in cell wall biosynthesis